MVNKEKTETGEEIFEPMCKAVYSGATTSVLTGISRTKTRNSVQLELKCIHRIELKCILQILRMPN